MNQKIFKKQKIMSYSKERDQSVICFSPKEKEVESIPILDINNLSFNNSKITIILDDKDEPWFKAKDVALVLEYRDLDQCIRKNIDDDDKKTQETLGPVSETGLTYNEKNTIFINESGLYQLILSSKKEEAKKFKKWITADVLPSIRKHGEYKLKQSLNQLTASFKDQLSLKEKENSELKNKLSLVGDLVIERGNIKRTQIFYIATSKIYSCQNIFKIGGVDNYSLIKSRFKTYNTERPKKDVFYYAAIFICHDYRLVENMISSFLFNFKIPGKKEMFRINFNDLLDVSRKIIDQLDEYISYFNCNQQRFVDNLLYYNDVHEDKNIKNYATGVWSSKNNKRKYNYLTNEIEEEV